MWVEDYLLMSAKILKRMEKDMRKNALIVF